MTWHALVDPAFSGRLCLMLLHSVWQVALLALAAWCVDRLWRGLSVERRYAVNVAALLAALAAMPITYVLMDVAERPGDAAIEKPTLAAVVESERTPVTTSPVEAELVVPAETEKIAPQPETDGRTLASSSSASSSVAGSSFRPSLPWRLLAPWIVTLYAAGVALMLARLAAAMIRTNRLSAHADPVTDGPLVEALRSLARQWSMRVVPALARTEQIVAPKVVGLAQATILLPASAISGLPTDELEMILAHELAHVRRHDMWVNLVQRLAEAVLFFNPALWRLSRRISTLREYCCDEMTCGTQSAAAPERRVRYATALLRVIELAKPNTARNSELASLAASGRSPSEMRRRVARLFGEPLREPLRMSRGGVLTLMALGFALAIGPTVWTSRAHTAAGQTDSEAATERKGPILRGRIIDESGSPLPDVQVVLYGGPATRFRGQETSTNANGEYRFDPLKTGAMIFPDEGGSEYSTGVQLKHAEYVPSDGKSWRDVRVSTVDRHEEVLDLTMTRGGRASGVVVDAKSGEPAPELDLRIHNGFINGSRNGDFLTYVTTDDAGRFTSAPIFPGRYVIDINDGDYQGKYGYPKIGKMVIKAGETAELRMTTSERPDLQDPFHIEGTAVGDDGKSMVYGGVGLRIKGSDNKMRTSGGGGIDGRNVFGLWFGPVERSEPSPNAPYGVGTHEVELVGRNQRFGYKLVKRTPSEPLRMTDDPNQPELQDGVRYIRPNQTVEFKLVFSSDDDTRRNFYLNVVGPDGTPVGNASVEIRTAPAPTVEQIHRGEYVRAGSYGTWAMTDDEGRLIVTLLRRPKRFNISIKQPGYGPYWAGWDSTSHPQAIPYDFTAELDEGWSVGGVVVDASGQPVEGVEVHPFVDYKKRPGDTEQLGVGTRIVTDSKGRWRFDHVPASMCETHVAFNHSEYEPVRRGLSRSGFEVKGDAAPTARIELQRGLTVVGVVTDESGRPIADALVRTKFHNDIREARTDNRGAYRLVGCEPRMARIVVSAKGRAIDMQEVRVDPDMAPVNFSMKPGGEIRVRVVDEQGNGIPKARIFFKRWRGMFGYFEFDHVSQYADEDGVWEWNEAPLDEFQADICRPDGMQLLRQSLVPRDEEYVFAPPRALVVSGRVIDVVTKAPIEKFRVVPGVRDQPYQQPGDKWSLSESYSANNGKYRIVRRRTAPAHMVRIEAEGYKVAISRDIMMDEGEVDLDFELQPAEDIAATILSAAGEPVANAKIALGVAGSQIRINKGDIYDRSTYATRLDADADGRFSIPERDEPFQLVITHPSGFAHLKSADGPIPNRITLNPWARVEGTFRVGAQPAPNVVLSMFVGGVHSYGDDVPNISTDHDVTTGENGRFVFERVFPGKGRIGRRIVRMVDDGATEVTSSQRVSAEFIAGKTTKLNLGGSGRPIVGKLRPPADYSESVLWNFALIWVKPDLEPPPAPAAPAGVRDDPDQRRAWWDAWKATDDGKAWMAAYEAYEQRRSEYPYITASVDRDGSFRIDDAPAGDYVLTVDFDKKAPGVLPDYHFSVPPAEDALTAEPLDLGALTLHKQSS